MDVPFVAIGNDELGEPVGDSVRCQVCGAQHPVEYGTSRQMREDGTFTDPVPSKVLGFYRCGGEIYLASVNGRATP